MLEKKLSNDKTLDVNVAISQKKLSKKVCTPKIKVQKQLIAFYGAIVRGIVFKI